MPYKIVEKDGKFAVKTITTGRLHGWTTKLRAEAQKRLLEKLTKGK